jgi:hypothetical protein
LFFDDDTFIEPRGESVISNEEGDLAIVQANLVRRTPGVLGHVDVSGSAPGYLNTPDAEVIARPRWDVLLPCADLCGAVPVRDDRTRDPRSTARPRARPP